jgi:hypothetical protein
VKANKRIDELENRVASLEANCRELNQRTCKHEWELSGSLDSFFYSRYGMILPPSNAYTKTCKKCGKSKLLTEAAYHELKRLEAQKIVDECNKKLAE